MSEALEKVVPCRRAARRDSLLVMTQLSDEAGRVVAQARVRNLSATGMMAECSVGFRAGDRVAGELRGAGPVEGVVTWVRNGRIGIRFDERIDPQAARRPIGGQGTASRPVPSPVRFARPVRTY